mmetsp:Transcript_57273/g.129767  ORF Transcript_57273/g.129767 Transcript_57273/m.129767 type:complete len:96 (-) Transcript_57273:292-579(-)
MNTKFTYTLGWGLFTAGTLGGAAYGMYLGKQANEQREKDNLVLKAEMQQELLRIAEKKAKSGQPMGIFKGKTPSPLELQVLGSALLVICTLLPQA